MWYETSIKNINLINQQVTEMTLVAREVNICLKQLYSHLFTRFVPSTAVPSQYSQSFFKSDNRRQLQWKKNYHISLATDFLHFSFVVPIHTFPQNEFICLYSFASIMSKPAFRLILHVSAVLLSLFSSSVLYYLSPLLSRYRKVASSST